MTNRNTFWPSVWTQNIRAFRKGQHSYFGSKICSLVSCSQERASSATRSQTDPSFLSIQCLYACLLSTMAEANLASWTGYVKCSSLAHLLLRTRRRAFKFGNYSSVPVQVPNKWKSSRLFSRRHGQAPLMMPSYRPVALTTWISRFDRVRKRGGKGLMVFPAFCRPVGLCTYSLIQDCTLSHRRPVLKIWYTSQAPRYTDAARIMSSECFGSWGAAVYLRSLNAQPSPCS